MRQLFLAAVAGIFLIGCSTSPPLPDTTDPNVLTAIMATVRVSCLDFQGREIASGTGVVVNDGRILTARHLWAPDYGIVGFDVSDVTGKKVKARLLTYGRNDWAVLIPEKPIGKPVSANPYADRRDFEEVFSVGYAVGLKHMTYTQGRIQPFEGKLARISAPVAPGNSGGGAWLPSPDGKPTLTGLVVAMFMANGVPYAHMGIIVPISLVHEEGGLN
jgi:hypothetical protein